MDILFLVIGLLFLFVLLYLFFLAAASLWPEKAREEDNGKQTTFAILIPAHDESGVLQRTLDNIKSVDYPEDCYQIFVVADNCTDNTAEIARKGGAVCWERTSDEFGKGYAVKYGFDRLVEYEKEEGTQHEGMLKRFDAFLQIDADTLMDKTYLQALSRRIQEGVQAIQSNAIVMHPENSPMESLAYLGSVLNRNLRYKGRTRLGLTTNLTGTMCFASDVIRKHGWIATSIVEDIEYTMFLHLNDIRVVFAPEAKIYIEIPDSFGEAKQQRKRWDGGKFKIRNKYLAKVLLRGIKKLDISYFDSAMELLIPPFSIFASLIMMFFFLFLLLGFSGLNLTFYIWCSVVAGLAVYVATGLILAGTSLKVYRNLLYAPYYIFWRLWIVLQSACSKKKLGYYEDE